MATQPTKLSLSPREPGSSRATRRLRREGRVPGIIYGGGADPVAFDVDERLLRHALAASGAVLELAIGSDTTPAVLKDAHYHPVRGQTLHVDFLRVRLDVAISATVMLDLVGVEEAPGVVEGGVLSQETREVNIEALPGDIPDSITHDVSGMQINDTLTLSAVTAPAGITLLDDLEETVIATITPPTAEPVDEDIETETALVGEDGEPAEGEAAEGGDAPEAASDES